MSSDFVYDILSVEKIHQEIASILFKELSPRLLKENLTRPHSESLLFALLTIDLYLWVLEEKGIQGDRQNAFLRKRHTFFSNNGDGKNYCIFEVCSV